MPQCKVEYCKNCPGRASRRGRTFHKLPIRKPHLLKVWIAQMGREESWQPSMSSIICSDHFEESCFDRTGQTTRIRENAVPTLFKTLPFSGKKKPNVIKFPFKQLRSGKLLNASALDTGGPSHDHDYVIKNGFLHREKTASDSERQFTDPQGWTGPPRDWRSYDQDSFLHEDRTASPSSASVNSESRMTSSQSHKQDDVSLQDETNKNKDPVPDRTGNIFYHRKRARLNVDALIKKRKRINKIKLHDHTYSIGDNPVVLKHRMDTACTKMAELRLKLKANQNKNRRLSIKVKALARDAEELRDRQVVIKKTLKFLESLEYRPKFDELFQSL